jgi:phosphate-selective porin OprO and OprP
MYGVLIGCAAACLSPASASAQSHLPLLTWSWPASPAAAADQTAAPGKKPDPVFEWKDHPTIKRGLFQVSFKARFQADFRRSDIDDALIADEEVLGLDVARRRVGVEGRIGNLLDFEVDYELANDAPWRDVFVNFRRFDELQVQAGRFKQPFSLDENTSATNLDFIYRSTAATALAPGRDKGVMVHGRVARKIVRYEYGIFEHDGVNAKPGVESERVFGDRTTTGRIIAEPFRSSKSPWADLLVGVAWSGTNLVEGLPGIRGRTVLGADFFDADFPVLGRRDRRGFELRWRPGPVSVKSEIMRVEDERLGLSVEDTDLSPIRATGWYLSGTWAVTGERKSAGLDTPKRPFLQGGAGAIEVAARIERLRFESGHADETPSTSPRAEVIVGNSNRVITFGVNWYLNRWVKVQFNLIDERPDDPAQGPLPSAPSFRTRLVRFQLTL